MTEDRIDPAVPNEEPIEAEVAADPAGPVETEAVAPNYLDDLKRVQAEFENFRKRTIRDRSTVVQRATAGLMAELLPVLDDFDLALLSAGQTQDFEKMLKGVELVYAKLRETLERVGLEKIQSKGKPFDPAEHEAVMQSDGEGDTTVVIEEFRPGYRLAGTILRPAMVKVGPSGPGS